MSSPTVALTGGIASGKSAAAAGFAAIGVPVFDADVIARELVQPGQAALAEIVAGFGPEALNAAGELDRRRMRERVFADGAERLKLEAILHPRVRNTLIAAVADCEAPYCVLAIPLLAEKRNDYAWVDRVLVIDVPERVQIERLMRRDNSTREDALKALAAQFPSDQRLALADDVIDNSGPITALTVAVQRLHARYLAVMRNN